MVYLTAPTTFSSLIGQARSFDAIKDCKQAISTALIYNPHASPKYGSFKRAFFGRLSIPVIADSTSVCIKQCWYLCKSSGNRLPYDNHTQISKLSSEINCLRWASALMEMVYDFIYSYIDMHGAPSFAIPEMRFAESALAIVDTTHDTFMLEEVIDDGNFVKYIGNGSVKPFDFLSGDVAYRADFLAFAQHVQYLKTKGLAFIGDFQGKWPKTNKCYVNILIVISGGSYVLTDPQIITSRYVPR
jgi:Alpha-kinase family